MSNLLHNFLAAGFVQSQAFLGEPFKYQGKNYIGFFSQANDQLIMQVMGYIDEADTICVVSVAQFVALVAFAPQENTQINRDDGVYSIRGVKTDFSSYTLLLRRISRATPSPLSPPVLVGAPSPTYGAVMYGSVGYAEFPSPPTVEPSQAGLDWDEITLNWDEIPDTWDELT